MRKFLLNLASIAGTVIVVGGFAAIGLFLLSAGFSGRAWPHEWFDRACCSDRDCKPIDETSIQETPAGYLVKQSGETIPYADKRIKFSPDGRFYRCAAVPSHTICLYTPPRGF